jgi:dinuclear metal center YbgI/SA1388 family protein
MTTTTVSDVMRWLEEFAPARLAEPWDNVGLLWGDPAASVRSVMTCLSVTPVTAAEAIERQASLIVSHHPVLFREVKRIRADLPDTGHLWQLARAGIAIASPHTAFDNARDGINELLCRRLGLTEVMPLKPLRIERDPTADASALFKVVVFTPESDREAVLSGAFAAGAGHIGAYEECSFAIPGEGTFFGTDTTNPAVGQRGRRETVSELRLEVVCRADKLAKVLASIRAGHSYEEPAIDVYPLCNAPGALGPTIGSGRVGKLAEAQNLESIGRLVARALRTTVQVVGDRRKDVVRVAVACGAGDDFVKDAAGAKAQVLVTGEARYHRALEAESLALAMVIAGHHATERPGVEELSRRIAQAFPTLDVWPSETEYDPFYLIIE